MDLERWSNERRTIGHAKQRHKTGRYIGISEPSIIAAEPPNAIVNELIIMPDIEKRLEAFVRLGHGIIVFPGGVGTAEELLYLLGILMNERNAQQPFPFILTGPAGSEEYFEAIDAFVGATLGPEAQSKYQIIVDDPDEVARTMNKHLEKVKKFRGAMGDAFSFNWSLKIEQDFQQPFIPTHESSRPSLQIKAKVTLPLICEKRFRVLSQETLKQRVLPKLKNMVRLNLLVTVH